MKAIFKYTILGAFVFSMSACTSSFSDINTNPHEAHEADLQKDGLKTGAFLTQMQNYVVLYEGDNNLSSDYQVAQGLSSDLYSGYIGPTGTWASGSHNGTYKMTWYEQMFTKPFSGLMPAWQKIKKAAAEDKQPGVSALADIIKVEGMHRVTDTYGPIPYCNYGTGSIGTAYDKQEDVYKKFFNELDSAIDVLTPFAQAGATLLQDYDNVYDGNVANWVKFANTLRLRLAMRVVYANPTLAKTEAEKSISNSIGVIEATSEHAELLHSKLTYHHPNIDIQDFNAGEIRMSAAMDAYMNGYNDPRLSTYFKAAKSDSKYHGVRCGTGNISSKTDKYAGDGISRLNLSNTTPIVWMTAAESYFLRAEGALRGWNMGGTAKEFYEAGIKASFQETGAGSADSYIANKTSVPAAYVDKTGDGNDVAAPSAVTIAWDDAAGFETNLERIITQKWLAMYPDGPEGWAEYRRTGYPKLFPVVKNDSNGKISTSIQIRRLPYPSSEYTTNGAAVAVGVKALNSESNNATGDNGGTTLWWDKKSH